MFHRQYQRLDQEPASTETSGLLGHDKPGRFSRLATTFKNRFFHTTTSHPDDNQPDTTTELDQEPSEDVNLETAPSKSQTCQNRSYTKA